MFVLFEAASEFGYLVICYCEPRESGAKQ